MTVFISRRFRSVLDNCKPHFVRMFHLDITADQYRQNVISPAKVTEMLDISPTVKKLVLRIEDPKFCFKAGQWVDMFIPDVEIVGGFSVCSAPKLLREQSLIELAVKKSNHPPVKWVHEKCHVGATVKVRAGGDFFYDPHPSDPPKDLLLLAGGVGINPIRSIILHEKDLYDEHNSKSFGVEPGRAKLLYCAKTPSELLFKEDFLNISDDVNFHCTLFASQSKNVGHLGKHFEIQPGRITNLDILQTITAMKECGISEDKIVYEAWTASPPPSPKK